MKLFLKILFFLLAIFQANISEGKVFVFADVFSEVVLSTVFSTENNCTELQNIFSENGIVNTCKRERDLIDYRNLLLSSKANAAKTSSKLTVQFGKGANQVRHAFRHTDALGLNKSLVQSSVQTHFNTVSSQVVAGKPFNQIINIGGQRIQYTVFKLPNGTFNIGRIHGVK